MATYTPNLNLKKPGDADTYDIDDFNGNMDAIDTAVHSIGESVNQHIKIDTYSATTGSSTYSGHYYADFTATTTGDALLCAFVTNVTDNQWAGVQRLYGNTFRVWTNSAGKTVEVKVVYKVNL